MDARAIYPLSFGMGFELEHDVDTNTFTFSGIDTYSVLSVGKDKSLITTYDFFRKFRSGNKRDWKLRGFIWSFISLHWLKKQVNKKAVN